MGWCGWECPGRGEETNEGEGKWLAMEGGHVCVCMCGCFVCSGVIVSMRAERIPTGGTDTRNDVLLYPCLFAGFT